MLPIGDGFADLLVNEIGRFRGETLAELDSGYYLLAVEADGPWSVVFRR